MKQMVGAIKDALENTPPELSADNSGGVFSNASLIAPTICFIISFSASAVSSSVIFTSLGVPDLKSLPLTG